MLAIILQIFLQIMTGFILERQTIPESGRSWRQINGLRSIQGWNIRDAERDVHCLNNKERFKRERKYLYYEKDFTDGIA